MCSHMRRITILLGYAAVVALLTLTVDSGSASATTPGLTVESFATPTNFSVGQASTYQITVTNTSHVETTSGSEIMLTDGLPAGLAVQGIQLFASGLENGEEDLGFDCNTSVVGATTISCHFPFPLKPDETLTLVIDVVVETGASGVLTNHASVVGGGAPEVATEESDVISPLPASFGVANFGFHISGLDGASDTQAGDHPYEVVTTIGLNTSFRVNGPQGVPGITSVQDVKDVAVDLPLGFVGSTLAAPQCTLAQLSSTSHCPSDTIIGHLTTEPRSGISIASPIYNLVPEHGVPAEFGYYDSLKAAHVFYSRVVPTPSGYVLQTMNPDLPAINLTRVVATFYGDPAEKQEELALQEGKLASPLPHIPFFTNPTNCPVNPITGEPEAIHATIYVDSWQNPGSYNADGSPNFADGKWVSATASSPGMTGCDSLRFPAEVGAQPTTHEADKPSGMEFELKVAQSETPGVVATPTLKKIITTLPEGFTVDPSAGDGLTACSEAQIGWEEEAPGPMKFNAAPPQCPESSKIGSLELETPLVPHKFEGEMFLASQNENPFNTTLAAYVVVHDPLTGVLIKIAGEFLPNPSTGRLTAVFDENPNLPFSDLKLHFFGGPRAELATPENCGTFATTTELFPYSYPDSGPPETPFDSFVIDEACPAGFAPSFIAGSTNLQAGAYTPVEVSLSRSDTDQEVTGLTTTLPPGLLGKITGIPLCTEAEIQSAEESGKQGCPQSSEIGNVVTGVGPGPNPLFVSGKAYLTGPYNGGPYGVAVIVPAIAGPYNFGTVVVRQSLRIDPRTAQVIDVSDPVPTIIDGIPLRLRRVDLTIDRPEFTFNPTSCAKQSVTDTITGSPLGAPRTLRGDVGYATQTSASSSSSTPFQVTDCAALHFAPKFSASTKARATRSKGASLSVKLAYPKAAWGTQADIHSVKVSLPKQLPSRLSTLQKACTARQFDANPSGCPAASVVGYAKVHTPVLPVPLAGPVYFVSNGGEAFPNLIMVLQGDNVTVQLVGDTFISKKGVTTSTFKSVPDVPFSIFELTLGQGPYSALAANLPTGASGSFCGRKLEMPTEFVAQNGAVFKQSTRVAATGCAKKKARRASRGHAHQTRHAARRGGTHGH